MITWRIWNMLRNPPFGHSLFRRTVINRPNISNPHREFEPYKIINIRFIFELLGVMFVCTAMVSPIFLIVAGIGILLILNGTIYSLIWSVRTSGLIAQAREHQTYDLYCMSPEGALGVNWAICTGFLHRNNRLEQIHSVVRSLLAVALVMIFLIALVLVSNAGQPRATEFARAEVQRYSLMLVHVTTLICLIFIDHIHSIVLSSLVGILVASYARGKLEAQLGTSGAYLMLQLSAYLVTWIIGFVLIPSLYDENASGLAQISIAVMQVIIFYIVRETMISFLWNMLSKRLNVTPTEEALITRPPFLPGLKAR
ncbi:MAG: hypothetical protein ABI690_06220 [Chloroflexota bacterium]